MGKALPRRIGRHVHPAARPEAAPEPKASGIDYLALVAERVAAEAAERIGYAALAPVQAPEPEGPGGAEPAGDIDAGSALDESRGEEAKGDEQPWDQPGLFEAPGEAEAS